MSIRPDDLQQVRLAEVLSSLSYALDLTEGQPEGHAVRTCVIGMRLADEAGVDAALRTDLFYALLLKDAGCSSNAARAYQLFGADDFQVKRSWKLVDWSNRWDAFAHVVRNTAPDQAWVVRAMRLAKFATAGAVGTEMIQTRCERGADIARMLGFSDTTAGAIRALDEHWDGNGGPYGLRGAAIPLPARILCLAQTVEIFAAAAGPATACRVARERSGHWFDPGLVPALDAIERDAGFWTSLYGTDPQQLIARIAPDGHTIPADDEVLDRTASAFARVIDAKSPYTYRHSSRVAEITEALSRVFGFGAAAHRDLRRAALLHDIGKLGVPNRILDKPERLTEAEFAAVRRHTEYTQRILERVSCFRHFAELAASHHERLDGTGYHRGLGADDLPLGARLIAVADVFEALTAERPYRGPLPLDRVLDIMRVQVGPRLCAEVFDALLIAIDTGDVAAGAASGAEAVPAASRAA
jgi:putative nucleotidyltransferase with HDIG domain